MVASSNAEVREEEKIAKSMSNVVPPSNESATVFEASMHS